MRRYLQEMFAAHGRPKHIRSDNGREFIAAELTSWLADQGVTCCFIEKGRPQQNAFVERFNGTMRNETLAGEEFNNVLEARVVLATWVERIQCARPHRGLGMKTPLQFAADVHERYRVRGTTHTRTGPVARGLDDCAGAVPGATEWTSSRRHSHTELDRNLGGCVTTCGT